MHGWQLPVSSRIGRSWVARIQKHECPRGYTYALCSAPTTPMTTSRTSLNSSIVNGSQDCLFPPISTTRPLTPVFLVLGLTSSRGTWHSFSENLQWITMFGERILRIETPGGDLRQFALRYRRAQTMATLCTCGTMALWMHGTISL